MVQINWLGLESASLGIGARQSGGRCYFWGLCCNVVAVANLKGFRGCVLPKQTLSKPSPPRFLGWSSMWWGATWYLSTWSFLARTGDLQRFLKKEKTNQTSMKSQTFPQPSTQRFGSSFGCMPQKVMEVHFAFMYEMPASFLAPSLLPYPTEINPRGRLRQSLSTRSVLNQVLPPCGKEALACSSPKQQIPGRGWKLGGGIFSMYLKQASNVTRGEILIVPPF